MEIKRLIQFMKNSQLMLKTQIICGLYREIHKEKNNVFDHKLAKHKS
jgi:hypothetical protein